MRGIQNTAVGLETVMTTENPSRNLADVLAQELAKLSTAVKPNASNILMSDNVTTVEQAIDAVHDELPTYNGSQIQLKVNSFSIDLKNYSTDYGGSLSSGFGGQFIVLRLASLQSAGILTGFTRILSANIIYWVSAWNANYPNGRLLIDGGATTIDVILGTNFVNTSCNLIISVIGY